MMIIFVVSQIVLVSAETHYAHKFDKNAQQQYYSELGISETQHAENINHQTKCN